MDIQTKKAQVLRFFKLGLSFDKSAILSYCTDEDIELLSKDVDFQRQLQIESFKEEQELLEQFNQAKKIAISKGNAQAIQWKLERINSERWGNKSVVVNKKRLLNEADEDGMTVTDINKEIDYWNKQKNLYDNQEE